MNLIEIKNLKKYYGNVKAVDDVSFSVARGNLFAFLGVNGAGKSTTINILANSLDKDSGSVFIDGKNLDTDGAAIREIIGIVFQNSVCDDDLTVQENLQLKGSFYGLSGNALGSRISEISTLLELGEILNRPYRALSGGQKRRVSIARGIINKPKLLFLDEPTTGLDPKNRRMVWQVIEKLRKTDDMTVFLTTHYMEEAETADKVVIIDSGKIIDSGTPHALKKKYSGNYLKIYTQKSADIEEMLTNEKRKYSYDSECYKIKIIDSDDAKKFIAAHGEILGDFELIKGNMDDVFLNATGKILGDL